MPHAWRFPPSGPMGFGGAPLGNMFAAVSDAVHTETNALRAEESPSWLWKQWMNVMRLRREGVPMLGFTWYSLIDQVDWDVGLAEKRGTVNQCGLFDLDRKPHPVCEEFRAMVAEFGSLPLLPWGRR